MKPPLMSNFGPRKIDKVKCKDIHYGREEVGLAKSVNTLFQRHESLVNDNTRGRRLKTCLSKVNESPYEQCGKTPHFSKGQNLLRKILRKDKY